MYIDCCKTFLIIMKQFKVKYFKNSFHITFAPPHFLSLMFILLLTTVNVHIKLMFCINVEALSSPMPAASNTSERHEMAGVNQAYQIKTGDEIQMNHDTWDDSENESQMPQHDARQLQQNDRRQIGHGHQTPTDTKTKQGPPMETSYKPKHKLMRIKDNEGGNEISYGNQHFSMNQNFENCCLVQVAEGAFDDRFFKMF